MRTSLFFFTLAALGLSAVGSHDASAADPGQNFFGIWKWKSVYKPQSALKDNPEDACNQYLKERNASTNSHAKLDKISPGSNFDNDNGYTCTWHDTDNVSQTTTGTGAVFICPTNSFETLANGMTSGGARDKRCKCAPSPNTASCESPMPPAYDTTSRCVPPPKIQATPPLTKKVLPSINNPTLQADYEATRKAYFENEGECSFFPKDLWKGPGKATVNIGPLCGFRDGDAYAADQKAGLPSEVHKNLDGDKYVWHHNIMTMGEMVLVKEGAHSANCPHKGSAAVWAKMIGEMGTTSKPLQYLNSLPPL